MPSTPSTIKRRRNKLQIALLLAHLLLFLFLTPSSWTAVVQKFETNSSVERFALCVPPFVLGGALVHS
uniref:Putative secreted protein n=1 Tax=Anopheles darlingi TaxID=43151 RepID=A0A2M4DBA7_ANODA